jgi:SpoVK/Ycf46/Vps4 family AAA+-type ATPase
MSLATSVHDLKSLVLSFHPLVVIETIEEERVGELLQAVASELELTLFAWSINRGLEKQPSGEAVATQWTQDPFQLLSHLEGMTIEAIYHLRDFAKHLDTPQVVRQLRDLASRFSGNRSTLVISGGSVSLPQELSHVAVPYALRLPSREELEPVLRAVLRSLGKTRAVPSELTAEQQGRFLDALSGLTLNQARQAIARAVIEDGRLDADDIARVMARKAELLKQDGLLEYFPSEDNVHQLGGFQRLKQWLERARVGFSAEARALNLKPPRGILLVGVQGCGKSLAARYVGREWQLPLLKLDAGRLYDKYIGETEKNFRRASTLAEGMAPCVLWIDEIEKAFAQGGSGSEDGGVSRRVFGAFLTWLQEKKPGVFVVATANDLGSLPPELIRKGRFDEIFFVDLPTPDERRAIFEIHLAQRKQDPAAFSLAPLLDASEGFSGAEIEQAVIAALYRSLHEKRPLANELLLEELNATVPLSVSRMEEVSRLRQIGRERFVPVS